MAGAVKHMERSHRSYKTSKPFADFERKNRTYSYCIRSLSCNKFFNHCSTN